MKTLLKIFRLFIPVLAIYFVTPHNLLGETSNPPLIPKTASISPAYTVITSPSEGATYTAPTSILVSADVHSILEEHYFKISSPDDVLRRFKLGYNPNNIYAPKRDVTGNGGNTHLEFEIRASSSGVQWDKLKVKVGSQKLEIQNYLPIGGLPLNTWTLISVPMADFTGIDFTQVAQVTLPYANTDSAYEFEFKNMVFTGGSEPFVWFGGTKFDNSHDGVALPGTPVNGGLNASLITDTLTNIPTIVKVSFYANGQKFGEDISAPYSAPFTASIAGPQVFKTVTEMSDGSSHASDEVNVTVNINSPGSYGNVTTDIVTTSPANGATFIGPANIPAKAQVNFWGSPSSFEISSLGDTGSFKLGYDPSSLFTNPQNVLTGGISHLDVKLRYTSSSIDWTATYIKIGDDELAIDTYLPSGGVAQNDWFTISIPLGDFNTAPLSAMTFMEVYSTSSSAFDLEIERIEFTESTATNSFLWFGGSKIDNSHDGAPSGQTPDSGQFNADKTTGSYIEKVSFYKNGTEVLDDDTYPYEVIWTDLTAGTYEFTSVAHYSDNTSTVTDVDTVVVDSIKGEIPFVSGNELFGVLDSPQVRRRGQVKIDPSNGNTVLVWEEYSAATGLDIYMVILDQNHQPIPVPSSSRSNYTSWPVRVHEDPLALLVDQQLESVEINGATGTIGITFKQFNVDNNTIDLMYNLFFNTGDPSYVDEQILYQMSSNSWPFFIQSDAVFSEDEFYPTDNDFHSVLSYNGGIVTSSADGYYDYPLGSGSITGQPGQPGIAAMQPQHKIDLQWEDSTENYFYIGGGYVISGTEKKVGILKVTNSFVYPAPWINISDDPQSEQIGLSFKVVGDKVLASWYESNSTDSTTNLKGALFSISSNNQINYHINPFTIVEYVYGPGNPLGPSSLFDYHNDCIIINKGGAEKLVFSYSKKHSNGVTYEPFMSVYNLDYDSQADTYSITNDVYQEKILDLGSNVTGSANYKNNLQYNPITESLVFIWNRRGDYRVNDDWVLIPVEPYRPISYAVLNWQQNANIYPTYGDRMYIQYPSRKVAEDIEFRLFDETTKTWDPIPSISASTEVGPNKYVLDFSGLTDNQTYLVSVINAEGEEEYFRILKRNF